MIHPSTEVKSDPQSGLGVYATERLPKGTIIWVKDKFDQVIPKGHADMLPDPYHSVLKHYSFVEPDGSAVLCWDHAKYTNHSYDSNVMTTPYDFEVAIRDIRKGEQLFNDYGYLNRDYQGIPDNPDASSTRKNVSREDILLYGDKWDEMVTDAVSRSMIVRQDPQLLFLMNPKQNKYIQDVHDKKLVRSIKTLYYDGE